MAVNAGTVQLTILLLVMIIASPRNTLWLAKVTRNAGILKVVMITPWTTPASAPTASAAATPAATAPGVSPRAWVTETTTVAVKAHRDAIERSIPPIRNTKMVPLTMMPMTETDQRTLEKLSSERKAFGRRIDRITIKAARITGLLYFSQLKFFISYPPLLRPVLRREPWPGSRLRS